MVCEGTKEVPHLGHDEFRLPVEIDPAYDRQGKRIIMSTIPTLERLDSRKHENSVFKTEARNWVYDVPFNGKEILEKGYSYKDIEWKFRMSWPLVSEVGLISIDRPHHIIVSYDDRVEVLDRPGPA